MKKTFIFLILLSFSDLYTQSSTKWYNMTTYLDVEGGSCSYSSKLNNSAFAEKYVAKFDFIENLKFSSFDYLSNNENYDHFIKDKLIGIRGLIDSQEILIIDSDLDNSLSDEDIIILPQLIWDGSLDYDEKYVYSTILNRNFNTTYEKVIDGMIHQKNTNLGVTVNYRFDSVENKIYYLDNFKICFNQKLVFEGYLDNSKVKISCLDYFPWVTSIRFNLTSKDFTNEIVSIKTPFQIHENGIKYVIDSVDFINNKLLISTLKGVEKFYFSGESLYSNDIINTDTTKDGLKLIHIWGSWCGPCVRSLPKLVEMQKSFSNVEFIGICQERSKVEGAKMAKKSGITWQNIFSDFHNNNLNIQSFPTYIIVNNNEVIKRFNRLEEADEFLKTLN